MNYLSYKQGQLSRTRDEKECEKLRNESSRLERELNNLSNKAYEIQGMLAQARSLGAY